MSEDRALYPPHTATETGMRGLCPRCGQGRLFAGFLTPAKRCANCGLDFTTFADAGDGPAVFVIMIVGFIVVGLALFVEFTFAPPYWVHALLWIPLIIILSFALLRPLKGFLLAQTYLTRVAEGRIES